MPTSKIRPSPAPLLKPGETVVLFDGVCKLCNGWARFLIRHDRQQRVRLAAVQSPRDKSCSRGQVYPWINSTPWR